MSNKFAIMLMPLILSACGSGEPPAPAQARTAMQARLAPSAAVASADFTQIVQMVYVGYFGRPADPAGLAFYAQLYASNGAPSSFRTFSDSYASNPVVRLAIDTLANSQESRELYPGNSDVFITAIYRNLFNRTPDSAGLQYWTQLLDAGTITRGGAALAIMAGAVSSDLEIIDNKTVLATSFTATLNTPARIATYNGMSANIEVRDALQKVATRKDALTQSQVLEELVRARLAAAPPAGAPAAPIIGTALAGDGLAILPFTAPAAGAQLVMNYNAICIGDGSVKWSAALTSPAIITGLPNGVPHTCAIQASNSAGTGPVSTSVTITPAATASLWSAPSNLRATGLATSSAGRAFLEFTPPPRVDNALPAGYLASCSSNGELRYGYGDSARIVVEGLRNSTQYRCAVRALGPGMGPESASVPVDIPAANNNTIRFVYAIPADRSYNPSWFRAIQAAAPDLQQWYKSQLGGASFTVAAIEPQICMLPSPSSAYFSTNTWNTVSNDLRTYCGLDYSRSDIDWIVYADVLHDVNTPGRLGAGTSGLAMLPRQDLEGLGGAPCTVSDEGVTYCFPQTRWLGGAVHEIAHTLGVPHPAGCDSGLPACDSQAANSIMWAGYTNYPNSYFVAESKASLLNSRFIR
ncbi:DUF4214 domain-containing protein [Pseudoduganella danionis]|uniref:DUF4214 domain-containing protein n=1 Tax=Pseudoduganella danionis TaxID=1890295 RepID=A0ABW9SY40_9BURK|nr:DUF4214 domain-containing protein [Pseudoduganella danionis]MTW35189.1 DUF4214 domain-containing protein [Pseudoduganella danionis]